MVHTATNIVDLPKVVKCKRCGHEWIPRKSSVITCANQACRSPYWFLEKRGKHETVSDKGLGETF